MVAPPPVLEKINLGKQGTDLCTSTLSQLMVQAYFEESRWRDYVESLTEVYARGATRCSTRSPTTSRAGRVDASGGRTVHLGDAPDFIDTTDLLARALRDNVAFVPGEAAFLDGRGRNAMRLNFSGSDEDAIREGIRRIGEVVTEQVELYGTLTGEHQAVRVDEPPRPRRRSKTTSCLSPAVRTLASGGGREQGRGAEGGRSLERQVSLRSGASRTRSSVSATTWWRWTWART